ncbi:hypothetical protein GIB67_036160 [Kingdonia uniflora]|uniref:protein-serine/threonine phosphatase n=1 Tax=Kingdonia uniflora TaxID=39325 RepID=A0A7J7N9N5_9MAGN|nr:hypothetical protein GIB67_036160 [Kingdonia uniflora]
MISMLLLLGLAQEPSDILLKPFDGYKMVFQDGQLPEDSMHDLARDLLKALHFLNLSQLSDKGSTLSIEGTDLNHHKVETFRPDRIQTSGDLFEPSGELSVSSGYNFCTSDHSSSYVQPTEFELSNGVQIPNSNMNTRTGSFSCLSGAALSANATLANTNICNGVIGKEILPGLDSPKSYRRLASSPSLSQLDLVSSSSISSMSTLGGSVSTENGLNEGGLSLLKTMSAPTRVESSSYLNVMDVQMAGGDAGEDRVQAKLNDSSGSVNFDKEFPDDSFRVGVLNCLSRALAQSESDFLHIVEHEMGKRPDLVAVGSCVLVALLHGKNLYVLNLGDSRAMLATLENQELGLVKAIQLTEAHSVDNEIEYKKVLSDPLDDPSSIYGGRLKGKLKLTRTFGVGYLKKSNMNDALMGILRVRNLCSPPYVYTNPFTRSHQVSEKDQFVVLGSDGLFDFFNNEEVVQLVHSFIHNNPFEDPAKYLVENKLLETQVFYLNFLQSILGFSTKELMRILVGRRRKHHDDVTVVVIILGNKQRTSTASTSVNQHGSSFDFGELEEAIVFQEVQLRNAEARKRKLKVSRREYSDSGSAHNTLSEPESPTSKRVSNQRLEQKQQQLLVEMASDNTSITGLL